MTIRIFIENDNQPEETSIDIKSVGDARQLPAMQVQEALLHLQQHILNTIVMTAAGETLKNVRDLHDVRIEEVSLMARKSTPIPNQTTAYINQKQ